MLRKLIGRVLALAAAGLLPAALQGCGAAAIQIPTLMTYDGYGPLQDGVDRAVKPLEPEHFLQPLPIKLECANLLDASGNESGSIGCSFGGMPIPGGPATKEGRNWIQNELMRRADQTCSMHISRMLYGRTVGNAGAKVLKSFVGAVNAVTKPAENVVDAMFEDTELALGDTEVLKWKTFSDTATRIEKSRGVMRNSIRTAQAKSFADYDVSQAMYDAERYHQLCSFSNAYSAGEQVEATASGTVVVAGTVPSAKPTQSAAP